jgi:hypothetical protein
LRTIISDTTSLQHEENLFDTDLQVSTSFFSEEVQLVDVQRILRDGWTLSNGCPAILHEGEEPIQEHPPIRILIHLIQPSQRLGTLRALRGSDKTSNDDKKLRRRRDKDDTNYDDIK